MPRASGRYRPAGAHRNNLMYECAGESKLYIENPGVT